ncbi:MAG: hypothetical protein BWK79_03495 [Beggiatoa sp. IS2]|nr:MAG: hypothetical protein BWK79_03495 [Beggiatoa sp. IS2]
MAEKYPAWLYLTTERLELWAYLENQTLSIQVDWITGPLGYRRVHGGGRQQPLGRAIGLKHGVTPTVVDATAGLGRDAFVLACLGCQVRMVERSPVIAALLHDGLRRAQQDDTVGSLVRERLQLIHTDAQSWLAQLPETHYPDVIYLDPMYPDRAAKSALVKKEMRLFRQVVGDDGDAADLLEVALKRARQRVVVKRPRSAPTLNDTIPTMSIYSKNTRFDVYKRIC